MTYTEIKVWKPSDVYHNRPGLLSTHVVVDFRPPTKDDDYWLAEGNGYSGSWQSNISGFVQGPLGKLKEFGIGGPTTPRLIVKLASETDTHIEDWWE